MAPAERVVGQHEGLYSLMFFVLFLISHETWGQTELRGDELIIEKDSRYFFLSIYFFLFRGKWHNEYELREALSSLSLCFVVEISQSFLRAPYKVSSSGGRREREATEMKSYSERDDDRARELLFSFLCRDWLWHVRVSSSSTRRENANKRVKHSFPSLFFFPQNLIILLRFY